MLSASGPLYLMGHITH